MNNMEFDNGKLVEIIKTALQIPGVKVDRKTFLQAQFSDLPVEARNDIVLRGPVAAKCTRGELKKKAQNVVNERTLMSTGASFLAGLPGGIAMAATIPADMLQFYAVALRLAQEIAYLYGEEDMWASAVEDNEKVTEQLLIYCGVMFGAPGVKLLTKGILVKTLAKSVPLVGGVVSGGFTLATMGPMGTRLVEMFDKEKYEKPKKQETKGQTAATVQKEESPMEEFEKAKKLMDGGIITPEEFVAIKAKLIDKL